MSISPSVIYRTPQRPKSAVRLFGERMTPVASPRALREERAPLRSPADLARHVLLHLDDSDGRTPWLDLAKLARLNGRRRFEAGGLAALQASTIQVDPGGGRRAGRRAWPATDDRRAPARPDASSRHSQKYDSARGYFAVVAPRAADRDDVRAFLRWLTDEAARETPDTAPAPPTVRRKAKR